MEKRILIAFLLSFGVLYAFRFLYPPPAPPKPDVETKTPAPQPPPPPVVEQPPVSGEVVQAEAAQDQTVKTPLVTAVLSNVGGVLKSYRLDDPKYKDKDGKSTELIDLYAGTQVGFPFAIVTADPALDKILAEAKFAIPPTDSSGKVLMEYQANGVHALKSFTFDSDKYLLRVSTTLMRNGIPVPHQVLLQGRFGDQAVDDVATKRRAVYRSAGKFQRTVVTGIKDPQEVTAATAGVEDQYFLATFVQEKEGPVKIAKQAYKLADLPNGTKGADMLGLSVGVTGGEELEVYIGPKLEETLLHADSKLDGVIDYGWFLFAIIAKPLLVFLRFIHGYVGNYGWAIIILTVLINMVLFPLKVKQQLSMQRMQKLAPHLKQLQEKYKKLKPGDPRRSEVEKELMEMNKEQLSGCLPMLMQMPLLFAFINMMSVAIELRGAPWILWITDLSQPEYVLPFLFGIAMFVQMRMTPTSPDPAQAKMALLTPILITALFLWYRSASGLSLYWLTGNVIGIGQQWFIRNYWSDKDDGKPRRRPPSE